MSRCICIILLVPRRVLIVFEGVAVVSYKTRISGARMICISGNRNVNDFLFFTLWFMAWAPVVEIWFAFGLPSFDVLNPHGKAAGWQKPAKSGVALHLPQSSRK